MVKKSFGRSSQINRRSEDLLRYQLNKELFNIHEIYTHQYKIDFIIELLEDENPTGIFFKVELKGIEKQKGKKEHLTYPFETEALSYYYKNILLPVYIVIMDVVHEKGFWLFAQEYVHDNVSKETLKQNKITLYVPKNNIIADNDIFYQDIKKAHRYMTDLRSTSPGHATKYLKKEFEALDNRFSVNVYSKNGQTLIKFIPNTLVPSHFRVSNDYKEDFTLKMKKIIDYGESEAFDSSKIDILGSPIYDYIMKQVKEIKISPSTILLDGILRTVDKNGSIRTMLPGIKIHMVRGLKKVTFKCSLIDIMIITIVLDKLDNGDRIIPKYQLQYNFKKYLNIHFLQLPYLDKLYNLFTDCLNGNTLFLDIEENGNQRGTFNLEIKKILKLLNDIYFNITILYKAKKIFEYFRMNPVLTEYALFTEDLEDIFIIYDILFKGKFVEKSPTWNGTADAIFETTISKNELKDISFSFVQNNFIAKILGSEIEIGAVFIEINNPILENNIDDINREVEKTGIAKITLSFRASKNSELHISLVNKSLGENPLP